MQNRYAGDVGDFMKLGLLRHLVAPGKAEATPLSIGLNWYLVPDEGHNADGKHITYVRVDNRHHSSLRACDPGLMRCLTGLVRNDRSVEALEACGALPIGSRTHREMLDPVRGSVGRRAWHRRGLDALAGADVVFADPDNGIRSSARGSKLQKFALVEELAEYAARGQSLVIYHHADHSAHRDIQARRRLAELAAGVGQEPVAAVIARRGTCRFFLVTTAEHHLDRLAASLRTYAERWAPHADLLWSGGFDSGLSEAPGLRPPASVIVQAPGRAAGSSRSCPPRSRDVVFRAVASGARKQSRAGQGKSVQIGYTNPNEQTVTAATGLAGTDHMQLIYVLRCGRCGHEYGSNGSDNHQRKCPECQGGARGLRYS
jgi:hypothetical protein